MSTLHGGDTDSRAERDLPLRRYAATATMARVVTEATAITLVLLGTDRGLDERSLGLLVACWTLPQLLTAPLVGALADRAGRPAWLLSGLVAVGGVGVGAVGAGLGAVPLAALCVTSALISLAEPAIMGGLSGVASRSAGPASGFAAWDAASYGAAGIGAQLVVSVSASISNPATTLAVVVAMAAAATVLVARLPLRAASSRHGRTRATAVLRLLFADPELRSMTVLTTLALSAFGGLALAAVDLADRLGRDSSNGSQLVLAMAIGGVIGSLVSTRRRTPTEPLRTAATCVAVMGAMFAICAVGNWPVCLAAFFFAGMADAPLLVATFATRSRRSPEGARASVYTIAASLKIAATSIGAISVGLVTAASGGRSGVITLAIIQAGALAAFSVTRYVGRP